MTGAASPNRVGGAHGGDDQHGCATRGAGGGGGALPVGGPARKRSDTRRAVRDNRLASQACATGSIQERLEGVGRGAGGTPARAQVRHDQGCSDSAMGSIRPGVRQAARGDDPDTSAGARAAWPTAARPDRTEAGTLGERGHHRPPARRCEGRGSGRQTPTRRVLLRDPSRGADPHLQRLERPAAGLLRDRPGGARWHVGGGLVHPDTDDGRRGDGLDRMPAAGGARRRARGRGDQACPESVSVADPRCGLRQRQRLHERRGRALVPWSEDRGDAVARLQEERPGVCRAEERWRG